VTITGPHHPFQGQSLEVLRHARMPGGLQFVLILPDGSKSLIPCRLDELQGWFLRAAGSSTRRLAR